MATAIIPAAYSRADLARAIPDATPDTVGDGSPEEREQFAADFNRVLAALREEFAAGRDDLAEGEISEAVHLANEAWNHFCEQQGDVTRTLAWTRARLG